MSGAERAPPKVTCISSSGGIYEILNILLPRFFRLVGNGRINCADQLHPPESMVHSVRWLEGFYCIPGYLPMIQIGNASSGIYAMDAASGVVVRSLLEGCTADREIFVLDLCCCPGSKFQMISDELSDRSFVVGVDNSARRISICRSLLQKSYHRSSSSASTTTSTSASSISSADKLPRQLLFHCDGATFDMSDASRSGDLMYDSLVMEQEISERGTRKRLNKSAKSRELKRLKLSRESHCKSAQLFDRVLVDAECTHSGSYRHMRYVEEDDPANALTHDKNAEFMKPKASGSYRDEERARNLPELQRKLAFNGFSHLVPDSGRMVYSTCSLDPDQNEAVIQWLLDSDPSCEVVFDEGKSVESARQVNLPNSNLSPADIQTCSLVLSMTEQELVAFYSTLSESEIMSLSNHMCAFISDQDYPRLEPGTIRGTYMLSRNGGTSGMFYAVLRKRSLSLTI